MSDLRCECCGKKHGLEPAFWRPDAFFAVPADERAERVEDDDDLVVIDGSAFFIRGLVPIPVAGRQEPYCFGFWVRVAEEDFEEYRRHLETGASSTLAFGGSIANQTHLVPPILGVEANVWLLRPGGRPRMTLVDEGHPLARDQRDGVSELTAARWTAAIKHPELTPAARAGRRPALKEDGWCIGAPRTLSRSPLTLAAPPRPGEFVKAAFRFLAADERGDVRTRVEFMWVELDRVEARRWCGTLVNRPTVPGRITLGSRIDLSPRDVLDHQMPEPSERGR